MRIKVNHFAAKTINTSVTFDAETIITEIFIGFLCGVFAYMGYEANIPLLLFLNLTASAICFCAVIYSIYEYIRAKIEINRTKCNNSNGGKIKI